MTTMSAIQHGTVHNRMKKLLQGKDAVDVAGWAHLVEAKKPWTAQMHFQKYMLPSGRIGARRIMRRGNCALVFPLFYLKIGV